MDAKILSELHSRLWHGADYNYEQWLDFPEVLREDFRLMNLAHCTAMSVGIFSWAKLEPAEGQYDFSWLDTLMDDLHGHNIRAILATPSAAHPAWLTARVPEVQRMNALGQREPHRGRQNFCRTSLVFREKVTQINTLLAERYKDHPALLLWHVSNEYGSTACYCPTCLADFRRWLAERYGDLDAVNRAWWTTFWSHTYTTWDEINPVDPSNNGLMLDWQRYNSDQVLDFYRMECIPLRERTPHIPITTNFMRPDVGLDYWKIAEDVDIVSWDSYPEWHVHDDVQTACETAFYHDLHRGYKQGQPFYLLESSPSQTNWQPLSRLKRPGLLKLASAQAVAHGALGVNYFQWRQSRGGEEKFHGAVVAHRGGKTARTFREVVEVGEMLAAYPELAAARTPARVAIIYDFENEWALRLAHLPRKVNKEYQATCIEHYAHFWQNIPVDVINTRQDFSKYALIIAPMLYLLSQETAGRLAEFVRAGGTLVTTYMTGWVNESDLTHLGASPLEEVWGFKLIEYDTLGANQSGQVNGMPDNELGLTGSAECGRFADLLEPTSASVLAVYGSEFYAAQAAITVNAFGQGYAYHLGTHVDDAFLASFYKQLQEKLALQPLMRDLPHGVSMHMRQTARQQFLFLMNFTHQSQTIPVEDLSDYLPPYGVRILVKDLI